MTERALKKLTPTDNEYFLCLFRSLLRQVEEFSVSPDRLAELGKLVRDLPVDGLEGQAPGMFAREEGFTDREGMVFLHLVKQRRELSQAEKGDKLSPEETRRLKEIFGLNPEGRIMTTTEDLTEEEREILAQAEGGVDDMIKGIKVRAAKKWQGLGRELSKELRKGLPQKEES